MQPKTNQNGNIAIVGVVALAFVLGAGIFVANTFKPKNSMIASSVQETDGRTTEGEKSANSESTMEYTKTQKTEDGMESPSTNQNSSGYQTYSKEAFDAAKNKKRIYFFHATWCPSCKVANKDLTENISDIPENVVVFKTDYDTNTDLKSMYGITYQHTFVQVDESGKEVTKWNGGGTAEIIANLQ